MTVKAPYRNGRYEYTQNGLTYRSRDGERWCDDAGNPHDPVADTIILVGGPRHLTFVFQPSDDPSSASR